MRLAGLQKLTLLDFPGHTACTVFTDGCNLRCPFCHNASLVKTDIQNEEYPVEEFFSFLEKRHGLLDGVAITGGEPLLHTDIDSFIRRIKDMGFAVKLDTNGTNPALLEKILQDNLVDYVAMDIKNSKKKYPVTTGIASLDISKIEKSIQLLKNSNIAYEFRTTIVKELHEKQDIVDIGVWLQGDSPYFLQGFVDSGDILEQNMSACSKDKMLQFVEAVRPYLPKASLRGID